MNDGITINSELDLYEKGGNSTHARWIADKILNARKLGIISEVELAVLDTALSDDFGTYKAYQAGLNQQSNKSTKEQSNESTKEQSSKVSNDSPVWSGGDYFSNHFDSHQSW